MTLEDLQKCARYRIEIKRIEESIESLRSDMERVTQALSLAPARTGDGDSLAAKVAQIIELERERLEAKAAMEAHIDRCENWLLTIPEQQANVLRAREMEREESGKKKSWSYVSKVARYSVSHCRLIYASARKKLDG